MRIVPRVFALAVFAAAPFFGSCASDQRVGDIAPQVEYLDTPAAPAATAGGIDRVVQLGRSDNRVQDHLRVLCEEIGPRLTGSHNLRRSSEWARDELASWGLEARLEPWGELPVGFDRGPRSGGMVAPSSVAYDFTTPAWTPGTDGPARGRAVLYPMNDEELAATDLAGAWVVRPSFSRGRGRGGEGERGPSSEWRAAVDEAMRSAGAAGEVRSSGSELVHTSGSHRIEWDALPDKVTIVLRGDQYDDLAQRVQAGLEVELEFDVDNRFFEGPVEQVNVVADLVGAELPDEYVIVCGHLDSWDGAEGALDNGTGVATTMEAARLLAAAGARPRRTIRFILWAGEEQGLLGSKAYVEAHAELMPRISAVLNHDGGTNYLAGLGVTPEMRAQMEVVAAPLYELDAEMPFELTEREGLSSFGASDHAPFVKAGAPGFFWRQEGRSDYNFHHHTQHDHFDAAIPEYQRHSAVVAAVAALGLADLPELLERRNMEPLSPRRMGVRLDGNVVRAVVGGKASEVGWRAEDRIVSIDGQAVEGTRAIVAALQAGGPVKTVVLERGAETIETTLDYSADPEEAERARRKAERAELKAEASSPR